MILTARTAPVDIYAASSPHRAAVVAASRGGRAVQFTAGPGEPCEDCRGKGGAAVRVCCAIGHAPTPSPASEGTDMDDLLAQLTEAMDNLATILDAIESGEGDAPARLARAAVSARFSRAPASALSVLSRPSPARPPGPSKIELVRLGVLPVGSLGADAFARTGAHGLTEIDREAIRGMNRDERDPALHVTEASYAAARDRHVQGVT